MLCISKHKTNKEEALEHKNEAWNTLWHSEYEFYTKTLTCPWQVDGITTGNYREEDETHIKGKAESDTSQTWHMEDIS